MVLRLDILTIAIDHEDGKKCTLSCVLIADILKILELHRLSKPRSSIQGSTGGEREVLY